MSIVRAVADARHVSVKEILSPVPITTFGYLHLIWEDLIPTKKMYLITTFDPYSGWSWREVLAWFGDAVRISKQQQEDKETEDWRGDAKKRLSALAGG